MPLVMVSRSQKVSDDLFRSVIEALPAIVAAHLDVPDHLLARLTAQDIEMRIQESPFDVRHKDLEVTIFATKFEARIATGQLRSDAIALHLERILPQGVTGFVWVILVDAFFSTFSADETVETDETPAGEISHDQENRCPKCGYSLRYDRLDNAYCPRGCNIQT